jgi:ABC-2 type transport system permease protein
MIVGTWLGVEIVGLETVAVGRFAGGLAGVAALLFALGGLSIACSATGRSRTRVLIFALGVVLIQFLVNLIGQLWIEAVGPLRPYTIFNYYCAQNIILVQGGNPLGEWSSLLVLAAVGLVGYAGALVIFSRRDLPAPL